jgi:hypothetical protein
MTTKFPIHVNQKVQEIIRDLLNGKCYTSFKGKRLLMVDRDLISIKVNGTIRLIYNIRTKKHKVLTHQDYNKYIGCKKG